MKEPISGTPQITYIIIYIYIYIMYMHLHVGGALLLPEGHCIDSPMPVRVACLGRRSAWSTGPGPDRSRNGFPPTTPRTDRVGAWNSEAPLVITSHATAGVRLGVRELAFSC